MRKEGKGEEDDGEQSREMIDKGVERERERERDKDRHIKINEDGYALEQGRKVEHKREIRRFLVVLYLWCRGVKGKKIRKKDKIILTQPILRIENTNALQDKIDNRINGCY